MFMKQYNYKPRTSSQSSGTSGTQAAAGSPPKEEAKTGSVTQAVDTTTPQGAAIAGRRRSSAADRYASLEAMKRGSQDQGAGKWADQKVGGTGVLGSMWNSFTKGT